MALLYDCLTISKCCGFGGFTLFLSAKAGDLGTVVGCAWTAFTP